MTDVFISYKREDEVHAGRLAKALEKAGFSVWWDRGLPGGESWRTNITSALAEARCVVVVWSHGSVGVEGAFVRDEAGRAMERGILVPVIIDAVPPPLGFGELQAIDLTHWRGGQGDPFFQDLLGVIRAKLENAPTPKPKGPTARVARRLVYCALVERRAGCGGRLRLQHLWPRHPHLHHSGRAAWPARTLRGAAGLGGRPNKQERLAAWAAIPAGSCRERPRDHVARLPAKAPIAPPKPPTLLTASPA